ncbi:MAG: MFS transporter [Candidatus Levybacteria bacterium]|nr:MFS transporter [Candidatus Levybacteria bacterium]
MFKNNRNLGIIAIIALVNSIGYGVIIPVMLPYAEKFGLSVFQYGLLFALFSLCQFLATPIIGRLSDKYGRRPLLITSLAGTALSFFLAAFAPNAFVLFIARALDGITAGNIPVAQAVISDTTEPKDRAKGFGIIGASFGFGFIAGPLIAALFLPFGMQMPFIVAGVISLFAVLLTSFFLPETNKHIGQVAHNKLFDLKKLAMTLFDKEVGSTLLIWLLYACSFGMFIISFQSYAVTALHFTPANTALLFTSIGVIQLIMQAVAIPHISKKVSEKKILITAFSILFVSYFGLFFSATATLYIISNLFLAIGNAFVMPMINSLLSKEADAKSQGSILGVSAAYLSLGTILGPLIGGTLGTYGVGLPFIFGAVIGLMCLILSVKTLKTVYTHHDSAF